MSRLGSLFRIRIQIHKVSTFKFNLDPLAVTKYMQQQKTDLIQRTVLVEAAGTLKHCPAALGRRHPPLSLLLAARHRLLDVRLEFQIDILAQEGGIGSLRPRQ